MPADGRSASLDASRRRRHRAGAAGGRPAGLLRTLRRAHAPLTALAALVAVVAVVVSSPPPAGPAKSEDLLLASFQDPAAPSRVDLAVLDGRLAASWPASSESDVRGYRVTATAGSTTKDFGEQQSPYTLTGLANGTAWTVRVRTVTYNNGFIGFGAQGPFTGSQAAAATATPTALPPTGLAIASADRQLTLSWNAPADSTVNGYQVWSGGTQIAATNASTRSYTRTGLVNGVTYTATVRATYSSGAVSGDSTAASGVPRDAVAPAAPTGLAATRGDGQVALTWAANSEYDVNGYRVLRDGTAVGTTGAGTRSYTDTGLTNDRAYGYALQALDTSGNTSPASSPAVSATPTDLTPPAVPTGVTATRGDSRVTVSWTANGEGDLASYRVLRDGTVVATVDSPATSWSDTGLTNGTTYQYAVQAVDTHGNASAASSPAVSATPADLTPPAVPTGLAAVRGDGQVALTWTANTEADLAGYDLYRDRVRVQGAVLGAGATSFTDTGLTNDVTYTFTLRARDRDGNSSVSSAGVSATPTDLTPPAVPARPSAVAGDTVVSLSWTPNRETDLASYQVLRDGSVIATVTKPSTTYDDRSVTNGTTYGYTLKALDTHGNASAATAPAATGTPRDLTPPAVPTGVTATRGDSQVTVSWTANGEGDLASYRVLRDGTVVATVTAPATSYTDTGLTNETTYRYTVAAVDTAGNGSAASSPAASATPTDLTPPAVPTGLTATRGDGRVVISWTANTEADLAGYDLYRDGSLLQGAVLAAGATSYTDTGLTNDQSYSYALRARDTHGNASAASPAVDATPTDLTPPAAPAPPSAVAGDGVVSLSWTPGSENDLASYQVLRDGTVIATVTKPSTTYDDRSVTNGTTYGYTLKALDTHGNASAATTPAVTATPHDLTPPAVPTGLSATRGDGQVVLSWTASTEPDLASYRVLRGGTAVATVTAPTTTYTDTGLTNDTAYLYALSAVDGSGNGSPASSPEVSATPTDLTPPAAPSGVTSTAGDGVVDVAWQANTEPDLASYRVYRDGQLLATLGVVAPPGTTPTSYQDSGLANGAAHTYAVTAVDTHGNESPTSTTGATPVDTTPPGGASGLAAAPSDRQVALTWTASPSGDVATYRVLRDGVEVGSVPAGTTSFTDAGLANGRAYSYTVVAVDAAGNRSAASGTTTTTPRDAVAPAAPTAVSATPGSGSATVRWTAPADTDLASYRVLRADGSVAAAVAAPATSATVTGLANGTPVSFTVVVVDTSGNTSPASASVTVTPAATSVPAQGAGQSGALAVSADGRWLVVATAAKLETSDTNRASDLYRIDTSGAEPARRLALSASGATSDVQASDVAVSANGRFVVVATKDKLVAADTNGLADVYRGDLSTTPTTWALVSVPTTGVPPSTTPAVAGTEVSTGPTTYSTAPSVAVSADGSRVAFYSRAALVPGDTDTAMDLYVKDLTTADPAKGPVTRASTAAGGAALGRAAVGPALAITPDGRYVAFTATGPDGPVVAVRKDLGTTSGSTASPAGPAVLASTSPPATRSYSVGVDTDTGDLSMSADGRYIAFSTVNKITTSSPGDNWSTSLAYRKDLSTGDVLAVGSGQTRAWEHQTTLSPDGRYAAYLTTARGVSTDANGKTDAYRRDLSAPATDPVGPLTSDASGALVAGPSSTTARDEYGRVVLLAGGTAVVITVQPMSASDTNGARDVYAKDPGSGAVTSLVAPVVP